MTIRSPKVCMEKYELALILRRSPLSVHTHIIIDCEAPLPVTPEAPCSPPIVSLYWQAWKWPEAALHGHGCRVWWDQPWCLSPVPIFCMKSSRTSLIPQTVPMPWKTFCLVTVPREVLPDDMYTGQWLSDYTFKRPLSFGEWLPGPLVIH